MTKNLIILAAGKGQRLYPVTKITPKPLIKIKQKPIIEDTIEKAISAGITEILIVVGYKLEKFTYLISKYNGVKLIKNNEFSFKNNISSLFAVQKNFKNSYIIDGDVLLKTNIFQIPVTQATYFSQFLDGESSE